MATTASNSSNDIVSKVGNLPIVTFGIDKVNQVRSNHPYVDSAVQWASLTARYAADKGQPVINKLPLETINNLACQWFDSLEKNVPAIRKTPEQLCNDTKDMYETSRIKSTVNMVYSMKDTPQKAASQLLDYWDAAIQHYLNGSEQNGVAQYGKSDDDIGMVRRTQDLAVKTVRGVSHQAYIQYINTQRSLAHLHATVVLMEYAKTGGNLAQETLANAQKQMVELNQKLRAKVGGYTNSANMLEMARKVSSNTAAVTKRTVDAVQPFVPPFLYSQLQKAIGYTNSFSETFQHADSIDQVSAEALSNLRTQLTYVQETFNSTMSYLAEKLPLEKINILDGEELDFTGLDIDDCLLGIDRENRSTSRPFTSSINGHIP